MYESPTIHSEYIDKRYTVYPANFCPLLTCGELAEFSGDFGEAI